MFVLFFFFKQKTAYEMRIRDWSSDVCSSDLGRHGKQGRRRRGTGRGKGQRDGRQWRNRPVRNRRRRHADEIRAAFPKGQGEGCRSIPAPFVLRVLFSFRPPCDRHHRRGPPSGLTAHSGRATAFSGRSRTTLPPPLATQGGGRDYSPSNPPPPSCPPRPPVSAPP